MPLDFRLSLLGLEGEDLLWGLCSWFECMDEEDVLVGEPAWGCDLEAVVGMGVGSVGAIVVAVLPCSRVCFVEEVV